MFKLLLSRLLPLSVVCFLFSFNVLSQNNDSLKISIRTHPANNAVLLRWTTNKYLLWEQTNRCGFMVERYTIKQNGKLLDKALKTVLNTTPIQAKPLGEWEPIVKKNSFAAIIAQALYGDNFEVSGVNSGIMNMVNQLRQQEQRFLVSMYAADLSYEAAGFAGWAFTDTTARKDTYYLYRVVPADVELAKGVQSDGSYTSPDMYQKLPKPMKLNATWGDSVVTLTWDCSLLSETYIAYRVEKSEDGVNFSPITNVPLMNMNDSKNMMFPDSLHNNSKLYYYRTAGLNAFGETGPYSEVVSGKGIPSVSSFPRITSSKVNEKGEVEIAWEFDSKSNTLIKAFELLRADADGGNYKTVVANILPNSRKITFPKPEPTNYFAIAAIPLNGKPIQSFSVLVQPIDSIPPAAPTGLSYTVDTTGVVTVKWQPNTESDLNGYRIYRSFTKNGEFIKLTDKPVKETSYSDTLNLKALRKLVYYRLGAVDFRYNLSKFSEILEVKLPDVIPPSSPVIQHFSAGEQGNTISWIRSSDTDVVKTRIYRAMASDSMRVLTEIPDSKQTTYTDNQLQDGKIYKYAVAAVDGAGLQSMLSPVVAIKSRMAETITVTSLSAEKNVNTNSIQLSWKIKTTTELNEIIIYRKQNNDTITVWKTVPGNATETTDNTLKVGSKYEYLLQVVPKGGKSVYSKTVSVTF